ncbi:MAG: YetF domain-containing protein [Peptococcaceae bacterium]
MDSSVFFRVLLSFFVLWLGIRILGKKEMGQLTYYNMGLAAAMGSLSADLAIDRSANFTVPLFALVTFFAMTFIFGYLSVYSLSARKLLEGAPTIVVSKGEILEDNLQNLRMSTDILMTKLRENQAFAVADVEYAIMETDGKLSVLLKPEKQPVTPKTMFLKVPFQQLPTDIIKDGTIIEENLLKLGVTKSWLLEKIPAQDIADISQIVLAQIDTSGQIYIDYETDRLTAKTTLS